MTWFKLVRPHPGSRLLSFGDAARIAESLQRGSLAVLPTETGYMLAAMATSRSAVDRVFAAKGRHAAKVMHVACSTLEMAETVGVLTPLAYQVVSELTPGPVTVVVEKTPLLPDDRVSLDGTVGVRVPDHPATLQVIAATGAPLTATSLNLSGTSPARLKDFDLGQLHWPEGETVYVVTDDDSIVYESPSTLVRLLGDDVEVLRPGPVTEQDVRRAAAGVA